MSLTCTLGCAAAVWFCFGTTHFCNTCHARRIDQVEPAAAAACCPAGPGCVQLEPGPCPLGLTPEQHPPQGQEFCIGCARCAVENDESKADDSNPTGVLYQALLPGGVSDTTLNQHNPRAVTDLGLSITRASVRGLPAPAFRVTHWLVHAVFATAAAAADDDVQALDDATLREMLQAYNGGQLSGTEHAVTYFLSHTVADWRILREVLHCSGEKLCIVLHQILHAYRHAALAEDSDVVAGSALQRGLLATADDRLVWEQAFAELAVQYVRNPDAAAAQFHAARGNIPASEVPSLANQLDELLSAHGGESAGGEGVVPGVIGVPCRFCCDELTEDNRQKACLCPALSAVCNSEYCQESAQRVCRKTLECGHTCVGVLNEEECPPCTQRDCALFQDLGDECPVCRELRCQHVNLCWWQLAADSV